MNGGRCVHVTVSSNGELSPKTSGTRSEPSDGLSPRPLEDCELIAGVPWVDSPEPQRTRCSG